MGSKSTFHRVMIGFKKRPTQLVVNIFFAYASLWTIIEPLIGIIPYGAEYVSGNFKFIIFLLFSITIGAYRSAVPNEVLLKYRNTVIKVVFGDLFSFDGFRIIPVSRYFHETQVVKASLQSKLIQKFVQSQEISNGLEAYKSEITSALNGENYREIYRQATGKQEEYYDLGTTAFIKIDGEKYLLFSLTETELTGNIPENNCNASKMWVALEKFWRKARDWSRGHPINIPLIGSGVTGIRLNPTQILEMNLLAIANAIDEEGKITTEEIRIVLHPKYIEDINLDNLKALWN
jgi:hypothetical protein